MKCDLTILKQNNISYSFATLLVGIHYNLIDNTDVAEYTIQYLLKHPHETDPIVTELVCLTPNIDILEVQKMLTYLLKTKFQAIESGTLSWKIEEKKYDLLYCLI